MGEGSPLYAGHEKCDGRRECGRGHYGRGGMCVAGGMTGGGRGG